MNVQFDFRLPEILFPLCNYFLGVNKVALDKIIEKAVDSFLEPIAKTLIDKAKEEFGNFQVDMGKCFTEYLIRNYDKYSKIKTLFYTQQPVPLEQFYVRTRLSRPNQHNYSETEIIEEKDFCAELTQNRRIVVSGTAGLGKSTFCKSVFLELINKPQGIFPIFIELRDINNEQEQTLLEHIFSKVFLVNESFTKNQLKYAIQTGKILLILDGYDEIHYDLRDKYQKEILELSDTNHNILILVSSRPDDVFKSWNEFSEYHIQPLSKENAIELINKIDYDESVKKNFLLELEKDLFEKHQSFAEIPLLLNMMLLTYQEYAEIPTKIHLFYEQAFLTLFHKHDAYKNQFKRKSYTSLDSNQFKKVFATFCYLTYTKQMYSFNEKNLHEFIDKALQYCKLNNIKSELYTKDLIQHVCLIHQDGLNYTFTHRSFQEYFTAYFIAFYVNENKIYQACETIYNSNYSLMPIYVIFELKKEIVENHWLSKKLQNYLDEIYKIEILTKPIEKVINTINVYYGIHTSIKYIHVKSCKIAEITMNHLEFDFFNESAYFFNKNINLWNFISIIYDNKDISHNAISHLLETLPQLAISLIKSNSKLIELKKIAESGLINIDYTTDLIIEENTYIHINFKNYEVDDLNILIQSGFYKFISSKLQSHKQFALDKIKEIEENQKLDNDILFSSDDL